MNNLSDMLAESLAIFESINCFEYLDIQLDLFVSNSVRTDSQEHWDYDVEIII